MKILKEIIKDILFRLSKSHFRQLPQGFFMWINTKEPSFSFRRTLRYYDMTKAHEPSTTEVFKNMVKRGDVVVDIGANMGYFSLLAGKLGARVVYAFEPEEKNFNYLGKNCEFNNFPILGGKVAISNKNGKSKLYLCSYDSGHHTLNQDRGIKDYKKTSWLRKFMNLFSEKYIEIETRTLDSFGKSFGRVDVIKMDCEGSELLALKGMERILNENKNLKMIIEFFPLLLEKMGSDSKELIDILLKRFKVYIIPHDYSAGEEIKKVESYKELMRYLPKEDSHLNLYLTK